MPVEKLSDVTVDAVERQAGARAEDQEPRSVVEHDDAEAAGRTASHSADRAAGNDCEVSRSDQQDDGSRRLRPARIIVFGVLPGLALLGAIAVGVLKWQVSSARSVEEARIQSVSAAKEATVAMLSYQPATIEEELSAVGENRLTGSFKDSYASLIHDVVVPGAKQRRISAVANVPAVASVSASPGRAVVMAFVNQAVIVGDDPPVDTASVVRITLEKIGSRWLISEFEPI